MADFASQQITCISSNGIYHSLMVSVNYMLSFDKNKNRFLKLYLRNFLLSNGLICDGNRNLLSTGEEGRWGGRKRLEKKGLACQYCSCPAFLHFSSIIRLKATEKISPWLHALSMLWNEYNHQSRKIGHSSHADTNEVPGVISIPPLS